MTEPLTPDQRSIFDTVKEQAFAAGFREGIWAATLAVRRIAFDFNMTSSDVKAVERAFDNRAENADQTAKTWMKDQCEIENINNESAARVAEQTAADNLAARTRMVTQDAPDVTDSPAPHGCGNSQDASGD
jgi:hypothetical protein